MGQAERAVADRERGFCQFCGAGIPHLVGEGRCEHCVHYRPATEPVPPWESVT
jgi:hypothetical protein